MEGQRHYSFLRYIDNRKGERLVQGVLLFLSETDPTFKQAFCAWLNWPIFKDIKEEFSEDEHRHDIVLFYENTSRKTIELKFRACWTDNQILTPEKIDLFIVPTSRLSETRLLFQKSVVKT